MSYIFKSQTNQYLALHTLAAIHMICYVG